MSLNPSYCCSYASSRRQKLDLLVRIFSFLFTHHTAHEPILAFLLFNRDVLALDLLKACHVSYIRTLEAGGSVCWLCCRACLIVCKKACGLILRLIV